jgi:hypothetical protein
MEESMRFLSHIHNRIAAAMLVLCAFIMLIAVSNAGATFTNPAAVTTGVYTAVAASSTAVSVNSSISAPRAVHRLEIQNQCASDVQVQFNGTTAIFGQAYDIPAGQTRVWNAADGPVPNGPYSFITSSATCSPATNTGVVILEKP